MEGYIAEIRMFGAPFAPKNWAYCAGQILAIAQNQALFSLVGTTYGGNGINTFGLPDLRSRVAIGTGQGPGLPNIVLGELAGTQTTTLIIPNLPSHIHAAAGTYAQGAGTGKISLGSDPTNNYPAQTATSHQMYSSTSNAVMGPATVNVQVGITGANQPFSIEQPYLGMNYIICLYGIFPSRN